jgi:hypothetical protein
MRRYTFYCFEAYLGRVDDVRRCAVWTQDPRELAFDPAKLIPIDLSKNPYAARVSAIEWDEVQVDDHATPAGSDWPIKPEPGCTTLGPAWPFARTQASVWLEERYVQSLKAMGCYLISPTKYYNARDFEFTTILEVHERQGQPDEVIRYNPHFGKLDAEGKNVTLFERGHSGDPDPNALYKCVSIGELKKLSNCHQEMGTLLPKQLREGSVFLNSTFELSININGPKIPHGEGL